MPGTLTVEENELKTISGDTGSGGGGNASGDGGDGPDGGESDRARDRISVTGVSILVAAVLMLFMALVSALVVRKGASNDWTALIVPRILWLNTAILMASSVTLVRSRKSLAANDLEGFRHWWIVTTILGVLFLAGQVIAWRQLLGEGVYLATNPSSSFFYVFTAAHGLHLLGGVIALFYVAMRSVRRRRQLAVTEAASMYWHVMDGLWVFIFLLFYLGR
jgi:cytochrome c oxidase subunit III